MARRRYFPPGTDLVHVSFKCVGDAFLMRPDAKAFYIIERSRSRVGDARLATR